MENVKRLVWVSLTVLNIRSEQVVIRLLVPLRRKNNTVRGPRHGKPGGARVAGYLEAEGPGWEGMRNPSSAGISTLDEGVSTELRSSLGDWCLIL